MATPILALIPSGYKAEKVYSVLPSNGTGDFTFNRNNGKATKVNKDGLVEEVVDDTPRLDYLSGTCPNLLLESEKTNSFTYSESATGKSLTGITLTDNQSSSPSGSLNAMLFKEDTGTSKHRFSTNSVVVISASTYTISLFVKKNSDSRFVFINAGALLNASGSFNLDTQAVTGNVQVFDNYGNGWYRIGITAMATGTSSNNIFIQMQLGTTDASYTGDESSMFVWGLQFEAGTLSSYIPTDSATKTRFAETCTVTTPDDVTTITETYADDTTNVITTIPTTYSVSIKEIKKIIMI